MILYLGHCQPFWRWLCFWARVFEGEKIGVRSEIAFCQKNYQASTVRGCPTPRPRISLVENEFTRKKHVIGQNSFVFPESLGAARCFRTWKMGPVRPKLSRVCPHVSLCVCDISLNDLIQNGKRKYLTCASKVLNSVC